MSSIQEGQGTPGAAGGGWENDDGFGDTPGGGGGGGQGMEGSPGLTSSGLKQRRGSGAALVGTAAGLREQRYDPNSVGAAGFLNPEEW